MKSLKRTDFAGPGQCTEGIVNVYGVVQSVMGEKSVSP